MPLYQWKRERFVYIDDFGRACRLRLNDYIGDAGSLKRLANGENVAYPPGGLKPRYVRVRALKADSSGRKWTKDIPVLKDGPLWTSPLGTIIVIHDDEYETVKRVDEKQYGRKKELAEQASLMKANPT